MDTLQATPGSLGDSNKGLGEEIGGGTPGDIQGVGSGSPQDWSGGDTQAGTTAAVSPGGGSGEAEALTDEQRKDIAARAAELANLARTARTNETAGADTSGQPGATAGAATPIQDNRLKQIWAGVFGSVGASGDISGVFDMVLLGQDQRYTAELQQLGRSLRLNEHERTGIKVMSEMLFEKYRFNLPEFLLKYPLEVSAAVLVITIAFGRFMMIRELRQFRQANIAPLQPQPAEPPTQEVEAA